MIQRDELPSHQPHAGHGGRLLPFALVPSHPQLVLAAVGEPLVSV